MDIKGLKRDSASIEGGRWVTNIPGMGSMKLRVRGFGSSAYERGLARHMRAIDRTEREADGQPLPEALERAIRAAIHENILLDWAGLESDGKPLKYDADLAMEWLTHTDYKRFYRAVEWAAGVVDNGDAAATKVLEKN